METVWLTEGGFSLEQFSNGSRRTIINLQTQVHPQCLPLFIWPLLLLKVCV